MLRLQAKYDGTMDADHLHFEKCFARKMISMLRIEVKGRSLQREGLVEHGERKEKKRGINGNRRDMSVAEPSIR